MRWTDGEQRSLPGQMFNPEEPSTAHSRNVGRYFTFGLLGIVGAYLKGSERYRGKNFVAVDCDRVVVGNAEDIRVAPLSDCVRVDRVTDADADSAMLTLVLIHGERIELPDSLYPEARGMFASKRHTELLSEIEASIHACIRQHGHGSSQR